MGLGCGRSRPQWEDSPVTLLTLVCASRPRPQTWTVARLGLATFRSCHRTLTGLTEIGMELDVRASQKPGVSCDFSLGVYCGGFQMAQPAHRPKETGGGRSQSK